jgi:hypothetical protein
MEGGTIMAAPVVEPSADSPDIIEWQLVLSKISKVSRGLGLLICRLSNELNTSEPQVVAGSRFELNAVIYECATAESITGWSGITVGRTAYVYAIPPAVEGGASTWEYSETEPSYSVTKGGWYNGNNRCLFTVCKLSATEYGYKQCIDLLSSIPIRMEIPTTMPVGTVFMGALT